MNRSREGGIRGHSHRYDLFDEVMGRFPSVQPVSIENTSDTTVNSVEVESKSPQSSSNQ